MKEKIKLAIVDDDVVCRKALTQTIRKHRRNIKIITGASDGNEFIDTLKIEKPGVVLMDLQMSGMNGIKTTKYLSVNHPEIKILILTIHSEDAISRQLIEAGAHGFLNKKVDANKLIEAIYLVNNGWYGLNKDWNLRSIFASKNSNEISKIDSAIFTPRERDICKLVCDGLNAEKIADKLFLSPRTSQWHIRNILKKTNVNNLLELTVLLKKGS